MSQRLFRIGFDRRATRCPAGPVRPPPERVNPILSILGHDPSMSLKPPDSPPTPDALDKDLLSVLEAIMDDLPLAAAVRSAGGAIVAANSAAATSVAGGTPDGRGVGDSWRGVDIPGGRFVWRPSPEDTGAAARFTAAVSHEIRTPLNGILGMAALLEETPLEPSQRAYVEAIRRSGARLLDLLNNVLDFSRLEAGAMPLEESVFAPADLIQDVAELLAPRAHAAGVDLASIVDPRLTARMSGDVGRLRQILFNLTGNAVKFSDRGAVLIEARVGAGDRGVSFVVRDTGVGIPADARERIFEAFGQTSAADSRRDGGAGLGLAICARLTAAMKGEIRFESAPGEGAMFEVDLPLHPASAPLPESSLKPSPAAIETRLSGARIALFLPAASALACAASLTAHGATVLCGPGADHSATLTIMDAALPPLRIGAAARRGPVLVVLRPEDRARIPAFRDIGCVGYLIRPLRAQSIAERAALALTGVRDIDAEREAGSEGRGRRVLVADDNAVNALLAKSALAAAGFRVDTAGTGAEALEAASDGGYDLIVMDIRMPVMDGLEATRRIRALGGAAGTTPIIALTADIDPELEARAREAGVDAMASKPIDPPGLRALAAAWTGGGVAAEAAKRSRVSSR
ncbi:response regulator [bacterium]|nr:response regulator [bacterium]